MRIVIGSDHAGFHLKATIIDHVTSLGHEVYDAGSYDANPVDFPTSQRWSLLRSSRARRIAG